VAVQAEFQRLVLFHAGMAARSEVVSDDIQLLRSTTLA